ncbi:unnamed protein product, partial [marine sediment metagenome]
AFLIFLSDFSFRLISSYNKIIIYLQYTSTVLAVKPTPGINL